MSRSADSPPTLHPLALDRGRELVESLRGRRVLVAGDLMSDRYLGGVVERISPEAPVPVLRVMEEWARIGGAGNVATNVAALGAHPDVVGVVGEDAEGGALVRELSRAGIGVSGVVRDGSRPTSVKTRLVARGQQVARFDRESDLRVPSSVEAELRDQAERLLESAEALAIEDYNKGVLTPELIRTLVDGARARGIPVVVDPKRHHFFDYGGATIFKPNVKELADALGAPLDLSSPSWLERVRSRVGAEHLLLTRGEEGMLLHGAEGEEGRTRAIRATARAVFDVSGAGDTVTAVLALALAAGASPEEAALLANEAAGIEVGKAGVATVSAGELLGALTERARETETRRDTAS